MAPRYGSGRSAAASAFEGVSIFGPLCDLLYDRLGINSGGGGNNGGGSTPPENEPPAKEAPAKPIKEHFCIDKAAQTFARDFVVGEAIGTIVGAAVGGLVAAGLTVATDTYPLAAATIPAGIIGGAIIGATEAVPYSFLSATADAAYGYFSCH